MVLTFDSSWSLYIGPLWPTKYCKNTAACLQHKSWTGCHKTVEIYENGKNYLIQNFEQWPSIWFEIKKNTIYTEMQLITHYEFMTHSWSWSFASDMIYCKKLFSRYFCLKTIFCVLSDGSICCMVFMFVKMLPWDFRLVQCCYGLSW